MDQCVIYYSLSVFVHKKEAKEKIYANLFSFNPVKNL